MAIGGALLVVAAGLVLTRPDDPVNRQFDALPQQGILGGGPRRVFVALVFGAIGVGWIVFAVSG